MGRKDKRGEKGGAAQTRVAFRADFKKYYEDDAIALAKLSYEYEWMRYESLLNASGRMIAGLSLVVVALMTAMPSLLVMPCQLRSLVLAEIVVVCMVLAASLILAVLMQYRYKYTGVHSPETIVAWLNNKLDKLEEKEMEEESGRVASVNILKDPYETLNSLNFKLAAFMDASVILLLVAIGLIIASVIVDCAVFFSLLVG